MYVPIQCCCIPKLSHSCDSKTSENVLGFKLEKQQRDSNVFHMRARSQCM